MLHRAAKDAAYVNIEYPRSHGQCEGRSSPGGGEF